MKCPECQSEMVGSQKGWLCLHCGHVQTASPHDVPLTPVDEKPAAAPEVPVAPPIAASITGTAPAVTVAADTPAAVIAAVTEATQGLPDSPSPVIETSETEVSPTLTDPTPVDVDVDISSVAETNTEASDENNSAAAAIEEGLVTTPEVDPAADDEAKAAQVAAIAAEAAASVATDEQTEVSAPTEPTLVPVSTATAVDGLSAKPKPAETPTSQATNAAVSVPEVTIAPQATSEPSILHAETHPSPASGVAVAAAVFLFVFTAGGLGTAGYFFVIK